MDRLKGFVAKRMVEIDSLHLGPDRAGESFDGNLRLHSHPSNVQSDPLDLTVPIEEAGLKPSLRQSERLAALSTKSVCPLDCRRHTADSDSPAPRRNHRRTFSRVDFQLRSLSTA